MACCCKQMLLKALEGLAKMPLAMLASLIPKDLPFPKMAALPSLLLSTGLSLGGAMSMSAMANLAASARLSASLTASAVARLEALAAIKLALGINPLAANASMSLGLAIRSMNMHLPSIMALLLKALQPLMEVLSDLIAMLTTASIVNLTLGINLLVPGGAMKLGLALGAAIRASASVSASVAASVNAAANLALHARLVAAASALGFNLLLPGGLAKLSAALRLSASLGLPGLNLDLGSLITLSSLLAQLAAIQASLNVNLMLPNAMSLLAAALAPLLAALSGLANMNIPLGLNVGAGLNASAAAAASLSASAQASLQATASANLSAGLGFGVPSLGSLGLAANLALQLGLASGTGVMQTSPCGSCPLTGGW
jgi:hypothetical protein